MKSLNLQGKTIQTVTTLRLSDGTKQATLELLDGYKSGKGVTGDNCGLCIAASRDYEEHRADLDSKAFKCHFCPWAAINRASAADHGVVCIREWQDHTEKYSGEVDRFREGLVEARRGEVPSWNKRRVREIEQVWLPYWDRARITVPGDYDKDRYEYQDRWDNLCMEYAKAFDADNRPLYDHLAERMRTMGKALTVELLNEALDHGRKLLKRGCGS